MPLPVVLVAIFSAGLLGDIQAASAKSPHQSAHSSEDASLKSAYSYPWCGIRGSTGGMACYYTGWKQCHTTSSGLGGNCVLSPYYRPSPPSRRRRTAERRKSSTRKPMTVRGY
jgi:hypothetical protein